MPNLLLTNLATYKAYFQAIATTNIAINGYKWGDRDVVVNANRANLEDNFLWVQPYENVDYEDSISDNILKRKQATIAFFKVSAGKEYALEDADFEYCESIADQILSKILRDKTGSLIASVWTMIATDIGSVKGAPVETMIGSTVYRGWELKITFMDNTGVSYDASKWI